MSKKSFFYLSFIKFDLHLLVLQETNKMNILMNRIKGNILKILLTQQSEISKIKSTLEKCNEMLYRVLQIL